MKILLTGATGFLGRHLLPLLSGHTVRALVLPGDPDAAKLAAGGIEIVHGDVTNPAGLVDAVKDIEAVIHLAGKVDGGVGTPADFTRINAQGTANLAKAAHDAGVERVLYSSSITIYGLVAGAQEDDPLEPTPGYPRSKIEAEAALHEHLADRATILRFPLIIGAGDTGFMLPAVQGFRESGQVIIIGSGREPWSTISARDAARALVMALETSETRGQTYNVNGATVTNGELLEAIGQDAGCTKVTRLPYALAWLVATFTGVLSRDQARALSNPLSFDASRFEALGYRPLDDWRTALAEGVAWALEQ